MKPRLPPADPMVETITISAVLILGATQKKKAKKNSAAMVGPSSMTPKESVRYEFIAHRATASTEPDKMARVVRPARLEASGASVPAWTGAATSTGEHSSQSGGGCQSLPQAMGGQLDEGDRAAGLQARQLDDLHRHRLAL